MTTSNHRTIETWTTVSASPLPAGWRNIYRQHDSDPTAEPCPAVLIQEHREDLQVWDEHDGPRTRRRKLEAPYDTRVVFATHDGTGHLDPVTDISNYMTTIGPYESVPTGDGEGTR